MREIGSPALHQRPQLVKTMATAFQNDPSLCWMLTDPVNRARRLPRMFEWLYDDHQDHGIILASPSSEVATFWRMPGKVHHHDKINVSAAFRFLHIFGLGLPRAATVGDAIAAHVPKGEGFLYLRYAAVAPEYQGKGWGGAAIRAGIEQANTLGVPTCLETSKPENVGIYQRMGFNIVDEWDVPRGGPRFCTMVRPLG